MKKNWLTVLVATLSILLLVVSMMKNDNTKNAKMEIGKSSMYSKKEIESAIKVVFKEFHDYPATLEKVWYEEDVEENKKMAKNYAAEEAIVLHSNFKTNSSSKTWENGFNPNANYSGWSWVLVRDNRGDWKLKTGGQG